MRLTDNLLKSWDRSRWCGLCCQFQKRHTFEWLLRHIQEITSKYWNCTSNTCLCWQRGLDSRCSKLVGNIEVGFSRQDIKNFAFCDPTKICFQRYCYGSYECWSCHTPPHARKTSAKMIAKIAISSNPWKCPNLWKIPISRMSIWYYVSYILITNFKFEDFCRHSSMTNGTNPFLLRSWYSIRPVCRLCNCGKCDQFIWMLRI